MASVDCRFPKRRRLLTRGDFERVLRRGRRKRTRHLTVHALRSSAGPRLGVAVPKRHVRHAVRRNQVKRQLREAFRRIAAYLEAYDLVVVCRGVDGADAALGEEFRRALAALGILAHDRPDC